MDMRITVSQRLGLAQFEREAGVGEGEAEGAAHFRLEEFKGEERGRSVRVIRHGHQRG